MRSLILTASLLIAGCADEANLMADNKVLCDPDTHEAYFAQHRAIDTSIVTRTPNADDLCQPKEISHEPE